MANKISSQFKSEIESANHREIPSSVKKKTALAYNQNQMALERTNLSKHRTELAFINSKLAVEQTHLSYLRTIVSLIGTGATINGTPTRTFKITGNANNTGATVGSATSKAQTFAGWTGSNGTTKQTSVTISTTDTGDKSYTANWTSVATTLPTFTNPTGKTCNWYTAASGGTKLGGSGAAYTPTTTVTLDGSTLSSSNYTVSYSNNTNAGTATVTVTGTGNYSGTLSKTFTIAKADISEADIASIASRAYTGSAITPSVTLTYGSYTLTTSDYSVSYSNNTAIGTATVTITAKSTGNFTGTLTTSFEITAASISGATVTGISNRTYTGSAITQTPVVKVGTTTLVAGTDYTVTYSNNIDVGAASIEITGIGNFADYCFIHNQLYQLGHLVHSY